MIQQPWYVDAVIYGVDIEKFADGNGDGIGDFIGLAERLPYIAELGVTCIWLLPFFGSPGRDNGYDVSDYYAIHPHVGTRDDFLFFLHRAGEHGIRVIIDLVANHTSNEHPWFHAARRDEHSRYRDYYVWSHDPPPVEPNTHSIFPGEETSVWTYDEIARAYYFHKFYDFQPDLNMANQEVREEILRVIDYWLSFGISGFRIDAAPLMISDNGLERANPSDPHGVLRELALYVRERRDQGLLIGEVNMPAETLRNYFGDGDQLGLLFNFSLACYIFAALARQDADPIVQAHSLQPEPPPSCGWANFLRNLDELDFSRVPQDLREDVFAAFAPDPRMQVYGRGVRRRLAPILGGDQRRIELAFALIMAMRGAPLFVYGDEIGLGEELDAEGRDAVRVPMQWDAGRNAGFSDAPARQLRQKPVTTGPFSYRQVNVAAQKADEESLLNRVKRLINTRRANKIFAEGRVVRLVASGRCVFAHGYEDGTQTALLLHNLADRRVTTTLDLRLPKDAVLTDLLTGKPIEADSGQYRLGPYEYLWIVVRPPQ
ncbi:alpha-amylase family protein [Devosia nitrariae]|uniref:Maltose alpha-D-glucosyltransferase n=1 Tax=Devosia nitrariae TaxID=2071872 RepID=A0ABQ5W5H0_9HYPH|nr:alpha-amylase family protein [Devosia nitrariae]GLQ55325.1 maltose alpha-D-glucosyltransferase [Devosia nitrariae]